MYPTNTATSDNLQMANVLIWMLQIQKAFMEYDIYNIAVPSQHLQTCIDLRPLVLPKTEQCAP